MKILAEDRKYGKIGKMCCGFPKSNARNNIWNDEEE